MNQEQIVKANELLSKMSLINAKLESGESKIKRYKQVIEKKTKSKKVLEYRLNKNRTKLHSLINELNSLEKEETCFGCIEKCDIEHEKFSKRCDKFNVLPF